MLGQDDTKRTETDGPRKKVNIIGKIRRKRVKGHEKKNKKIPGDAADAELQGTGGGVTIDLAGNRAPQQTKPKLETK